jgi:curved DNA-binding protein CbpA
MVPEDNPYACLGLLPGSPASEVKRRYRQLAKQYHPDSNHEASAEDKLREMNAAYAFLSDPRRKAAYDSAFEARAATFNPARVPQTVRPYHRRGPSLHAALGFTLLFLLSAGAGFLFSGGNAGLALSGLYARLSSRSDGPDRPTPPYTFLPSHGAFDDASGVNPPPSSISGSTVPGSNIPGAAASAPSPNQASLP